MGLVLNLLRILLDIGSGIGAITWLYHGSPDIAESVQYSETAESIWLQLNNRYGSVNRIKVFEIKRELASTFQGTLDIASYFNKLKKLWDELGIMCSSHANSCVCAAKVGLQKEKEEDKVDQFLMGLNEVYIKVRSNILMMRRWKTKTSYPQHSVQLKISFF